MSERIEFENIYKRVTDLARKEDEKLRKVRKGIFYMPELAFAYSVGKHLYYASRQIFGKSAVDWQREVVIGHGGPSDLVIRLKSGKDGKDLVIEFKMRETWGKYIADIEKLESLDGSEYDRMFVALVDASLSRAAEDVRIVSIQRRYSRLKRLGNGEFQSFRTLQDGHLMDREVLCVIAAWHF